MSTLTALNLDVLNYMMSVLPTADLSALMKTCKYLYEVALQPLCTRSSTPLNSEARVASFHRFLRINSGPSSRAPFIKALWLDSENDEDTYLGILRHCHKVRRLLLGMWSEEIESSLILHVIATSLPSLEEFSLVITPAVTVTEEELRNLVQLPLRKLQLIGNMNSCPNALSAIVPLGRTLVELGRISFDTLRPPIGGSFPGVERLHVHFDHTDTFVESVTASFPGVTHLALLRCNTFIHLAVARNLRAQNRQRWQEASKSWRSLKAVWAADLCELYACGLARHTAHLSVPFTFDTTTTPMFMRDILADLRPSSLALRIQLGTLRDRPPLVQLLTAFEASLSSCVRLTLRLVTPAWATYDGAPAALLLVRRRLQFASAYVMLNPFPCVGRSRELPPAKWLPHTSLAATRSLVGNGLATRAGADPRVSQGLKVTALDRLRGRRGVALLGSSAATKGGVHRPACARSRLSRDERGCGKTGACERADGRVRGMILRLMCELQCTDRVRTQIFVAAKVRLDRPR